MAKKKSTKSKSSARSTSKKKTNRQAKATKPKGSARKPVKKSAKKAAKPAPSTKRSSPTSVDSVLKKFKKERVTLDANLATVRKKIEDLNAKTRAFAEQIAKLTEKELITEDAIEQLDARRDAEVSELLTKLGVNLSASSNAAATSTDEPTSTSPFAVLLPNSDDGDADESDDDNAEESDDDTR